MATGTRLRYIDWARGVAVLIMLQAHTFDAWTRPTDRSTPLFRQFMVVAGFAAPLFLWLAGLVAVLAAEASLRATGRRARAAETICKRGLQIFILAFLFRLQAFIVSPGNSLLSLFRVDILNVMGPAIVVVGVVWLVCRTRRGAILGLSLLAAAITLSTPVVRLAEWVTTLPFALQWYLRPMGEYTVFTLFPWSGFVLAGGATGGLLAGVATDRLQRLHFVLGAVGAGLVVAGFYGASLPSPYAESNFWTTSPAYFAIRVGIMTAGLAMLYFVEQALSLWSVALLPLARLGQSSLFVYWIHVELVYGYASWPLRRQLPLGYSIAAWVVFSVLMYGAVLFRDYFASKYWRSLESRAEAINPRPA